MISPPESEKILLARCRQLAGLSFGQLATHLNVVIPQTPSQRKGWAGMAIELFLGADAGSKACPDFSRLGIELKTIPLSVTGYPAESTFITSISLLTIHQETWDTSVCYSKLKKVLWVPLEDDEKIPFSHRRIGQALLWSPTTEQMSTLAADWEHLTTLIATGYLEDIDATIGQYLQIRPKAANARSLCFGIDSEGNKIKTLPRGFYLRSLFTQQIVNIAY